MGERDLAADAQAFEDGVTKDTEGGAFRVSLTSREGLAADADNNLVAHVGFHDPNDPEGPGHGIPGAQVQLDAYMPGGEAFVDAVEANYIGGGRYEISGLELGRAGVWQFEFSIAVGETLDESVAFVFSIPD